MLSISSALFVFFSEKIPSDVLVDVCRVDAHVDPDLCSCWFNDAYIRSVKRSDTARGRFTIFLGLTRDEHFLFYLGCQSRLAGHFGDVRALQKHPFGQPFLRMTPSPLLWRAPRNDNAFLANFESREYMCAKKLANSCAFSPS